MGMLLSETPLGVLHCLTFFFIVECAAMFAMVDAAIHAMNWTPWHGWLMDVAKTVIPVVLGALVAVFFVNRSQRKHAARRDRHNMESQFKVDCLQEFRRFVYQYESVARCGVSTGCSGRDRSG
jgi:hypothetical protein